MTTSAISGCEIGFLTSGTNLTSPLPPTIPPTAVQRPPPIPPPPHGAMLQPQQTQIFQPVYLVDPNYFAALQQAYVSPAPLTLQQAPAAAALASSAPTLPLQRWRSDPQLNLSVPQQQMSPQHSSNFQQQAIAAATVGVPGGGNNTLIQPLIQSIPIQNNHTPAAAATASSATPTFPPNVTYFIAVPNHNYSQLYGSYAGSIEATSGDPNALVAGTTLPVAPVATVQDVWLRHTPATLAPPPLAPSQFLISSGPIVNSPFVNSSIVNPSSEAAAAAAAAATPQSMIGTPVSSSISSPPDQSIQPQQFDSPLNESGFYGSFHYDSNCSVLISPPAAAATGFDGIQPLKEEDEEVEDVGKDEEQAEDNIQDGGQKLTLSSASEIPSTITGIEVEAQAGSAQNNNEVITTATEGYVNDGGGGIIYYHQLLPTPPQPPNRNFSCPALNLSSGNINGPIEKNEDSLSEQQHDKRGQQQRGDPARSSVTYP